MPSGFIPNRAVHYEHSLIFLTKGKESETRARAQFPTSPSTSRETDHTHLLSNFTD